MCTQNPTGAGAAPTRVNGDAIGREISNEQRKFDKSGSSTVAPQNVVPVTRDIPIPQVTFQAAPSLTAADRNAAAAANDAPQALGGLASRFSVPVGKQGYSKSLRPEAGRLIR